MFFYTFMPKLFNMSLTASAAIALVILLRLLLKKAPKVISYALWGVVLFRLLCPVSIESSFSLYNLFDAPTEESGTITISDMTAMTSYLSSRIPTTSFMSKSRMARSSTALGKHSNKTMAKTARYRLCPTASSP